jgi:YbbR domain-containing protein
VEYGEMVAAVGETQRDRNCARRQDDRVKQKWFGWVGNFGSLALALLLGLAVWVNAVSTEDPDEVRTLTIPAPVSISGLSADLVSIGGEDTSVRLTLRAPRSVWSRVQAGQIHVEADLGEKGIGVFTVPLAAVLADHPMRVEKMEPASLQVSVEQLETRTLSVRVELSGQLAVGFAAGLPTVFPAKAVVSGPASLVDRVVDVIAPMSITGLRSDANGTAKLVALDSDGHPVPGVSLQPVASSVAVSIAQQGGYRDFVVKAVVIGAVQSGFRLTGLTVTPSVVSLFSTDPAIVLGMPGYVETEPLDITGAKDDVVRALALKLPAGVSVVGNSGVEVRVSISAIEGSQTVTCKIQYQRVGSGLGVVSISPSNTDVIITGPLDDLRNLKTGDVQVMLDLSGLGPGTYKLTPTVHLASTNLRVMTISPAQVEVVIAWITKAP